jgi:hypothetical protein
MNVGELRTPLPERTEIKVGTRDGHGAPGHDTRANVGDAARPWCWVRQITQDNRAILVQERRVARLNDLGAWPRDDNP